MKDHGGRGWAWDISLRHAQFPVYAGAAGSGGSFRKDTSMLAFERGSQGAQKMVERDPGALGTEKGKAR